MATEVHKGANGNPKKDEVEPLGELKGKEELKKPADLSHSGDVNGCETLAEKEEPLAKVPTPDKQKGTVLPYPEEEEEEEEEEVGNEPQHGNTYSSEDEGDGEGDEDAREAVGEPYEEDDDEEFVDDGEDEEGDDEESQPPPKRRK